MIDLRPQLSLSSLRKKVDINFINNIHKKILNGVKPNLVFILKVNERISRMRLKKEKRKTGMIIFPNPFILRLKIFF